MSAEKVVSQALKGKGWTEADLISRRKGDAGKIALAEILRERTTMPLSWIAARLKMGSRGYLTWLLQRHRRRTSTRRTSQNFDGCESGGYVNTIN